MSAHRAEVALKINRIGHDAPVFDADDMAKRAATAQLQAGSYVNPDFNNDAMRVQNLRHAGAIAEFSELLGLDVGSWFDIGAVRAALSTPQSADLGWLPPDESAPTPVQLYEHALRILGHFASSDIVNTTDVKFLQARAETFWLYVRGLRLDRLRTEAWLTELSEVDEDRFFAGTGIEHYRLHFECERLLGLCQSRSIEALSNYLATERTNAAQQEAPRSWWLGRLQLVHGFAQYQAGQIDALALLRMLTDTVSGHAPDTAWDRFRSGQRQSPEFIIHQLNAALCAMDVAHRIDGPADDNDELVFPSAERAVDCVGRLFERWRILARSQSPLAAAMRACLGDVADVCAEHAGAFNDLGFKVATLIKQNTLSHLLQHDSISLPKHIQEHLARISQIDNDLWNADLPARTREELWDDRRTARAQLERSIQARLHLMSLDYLDPRVVNTGDILANLGGRAALDYVWIESTARPYLTWYRTFISSDGELDFAKQPRHFTHSVGDQSVPDHQLPELSEVLLPDGLAKVTQNGSTPELLISPHTSLDVIPWAALSLGPHGPRLVESFVISLTPCLANLSATRPRPVRSPALARLVAAEIEIDSTVIGHRLNLEKEFHSWGHDYNDDSFDGVLFFSSQPSQALPSDDLRQVLRQSGSQYGLLHLAAHGGGSGLRGAVYLPEPFTAAEAFSVPWPAAVLLAVCHAGEITAGRLTEPLAFCIAVLAGGGSAVTAGIGQVSDEGAGLIASRMVEFFRSGSTGTLPELLREAQLHAISKNVATWKWSRFVTYVR